MRGDLRRLLWRCRVGVIRRTAVEDAVEETCRHLVDERFTAKVPFQEVSSFARPFLVQFEKKISESRRAARHGNHGRAIVAVERAETALAAARRIARAHEAWENILVSWTQLQDRFDLTSLAHQSTVREGSRMLVLAESFLQAGEARKALFVIRQSQVTLATLNVSDPDQERRRTLLRRLMRSQRSSSAPPKRLVQTLGRIADEGLLNLAERLLDDWEMAVEETGKRLLEGDRDRQRIAQCGHEARKLAQELSRLASGEATGVVMKEGQQGDERIEIGG